MGSKRDSCWPAGWRRSRLGPAGTQNVGRGYAQKCGDKPVDGGFDPFGVAGERARRQRQEQRPTLSSRLPRRSGRGSPGSPAQYACRQDRFVPYRVEHLTPRT
jgi:hypothetical protein